MTRINMLATAAIVAASTMAPSVFAGRDSDTSPNVVLAQSTYSWRVEVGFRCDDGRCYLTASGGVSYSRSEAERSIDIAINAMIQREARKGAKPTGSVNARVNGQKVK